MHIIQNKATLLKKAKILSKKFKSKIFIYQKSKPKFV